MAVHRTIRFADLLYLADTPEDYLAAIERALAEDGDRLRPLRMQSVAGLSWDARFRETVETIEISLAALA